MAQKISGIVAFKAKHGKGIKIDGGDQWYNGTTQQFANLDKGSAVEIEHEDGKVVSVKSSGPAPAAQKSSGDTKKWVDHQNVIAFQAARNSALSLLSSIIALDNASDKPSVKWPEAPAKRLEAIEAFIDMTTQRYYEQAVRIDKGDDVQDVLFGEDA